MAKVIFTDLIRQVSGSLSKDSAYYYRRTPSGKTTICLKPGYRAPKTPELTPEQIEQQRQKAITEAQRKQQERFKSLQTMVAEIMQTEATKQWFTQKWKAQLKKSNGKSTLRGYIMSWLSEMV